MFLIASDQGIGAKHLNLFKCALWRNIKIWWEEEKRFEMWYNSSSTMFMFLIGSDQGIGAKHLHLFKCALWKNVKICRNRQNCSTCDIIPFSKMLSKVIYINSRLYQGKDKQTDSRTFIQPSINFKKIK